MILLLARLAIHYHRPDFTEGQSKLIIEDLVSDLDEFTYDQIECAVRAHRNDPRARFFPTSGQLRLHAEKARAASAEALRDSLKPKRTPEFGDSRPAMWWFQRKMFWKTHWHVDQIPERARENYDLWLKKVKAGEVIGCNPNDY